MPRVNYTKHLEEAYVALYKSCQTDVKKFDTIDSLVEKILAHRSRYESVADVLGIPWYFIAAIHNMESSQNFSKHLHNGDPLQARTKHVPAGRPKKGTPPFSWEESAIDALKLRKLQKVKEWTLPRMLYELEGYNGWGYRLYHTHVRSPYLWSWSNHYHSGKYVADGTWSDTAKSRQCGAVVLIKRLEERGEIRFSTIQKPIFIYSTKNIEHADKLQIFLNQFDGIALRVDGWPGKKTSDAVKELFGCYLLKDPRND